MSTVVTAQGEFRVNTTTLGDQSQSTVTALSDGGFVVTWTSVGQDGSGCGVYGQRYSSTGEAVGSEFQVNTATLHDQIAPMVAALPNGGFVVTWTSEGQDGPLYGVYGTNYGVYGQIFALANDAPSGVTVVGGGSLAVTESSVNGTLVGTVQGQDPDDTALTYTLIDDAGGRFAIDNQGRITVADGSFLDYERQQSHVVTVHVSDPAGASFETSFTIAMLDGNDSPSSDAIADHSSPEDQAWSFQIPANTFSDEDGDALSYSVSLGDGSALPDWLSFDAATRTFSGTPPLNFNGPLDLKVTASDGMLSASDTFRLDIAPRNDAPIATPVTLPVAWEETLFKITTAQLLAGASDVDGPGLTISSLSLASGSGTLLDNGNGTWTVVPGKDFNGALSFNFSVTDGSASASSSAIVNVAPVNDAPLFTALSNSMVWENSPNGALAGRFSTYDPDPTDWHTYALLDDAGGRFELSGSGLRVRDGVRLDYEQASHHTVVIRTTDRAGASIDQAFVIAVADQASETSSGSAGSDTIVGGFGMDRLSGGLGSDLCRHEPRRVEACDGAKYGCALVVGVIRDDLA